MRWPDFESALPINYNYKNGDEDSFRREMTYKILVRISLIVQIRRGIRGLKHKVLFITNEVKLTYTVLSNTLPYL